jgi:ATP/maltotriose-dependent transcriptional regulator MalT
VGLDDLGHAVVLRDHDLRFTDEEVASFAALRGVTNERLHAARGWPALAELLATEGVAPDEFVYEQALHGLADDRRTALVAIAAAGGSDRDLLDRLVGEPNIEAVVEGLALIVAGRSGWYEVHPLRADAVLRNVADETVAAVRGVASHGANAATRIAPFGCWPPPAHTTSSWRCCEQSSSPSITRPTPGPSARGPR